MTNQPTHWINAKPAKPGDFKPLGQRNLLFIFIMKRITIAIAFIIFSGTAISQSTDEQTRLMREMVDLQKRAEKREVERDSAKRIQDQIDANNREIQKFDEAKKRSRSTPQKLAKPDQ